MTKPRYPNESQPYRDAREGQKLSCVASAFVLRALRRTKRALRRRSLCRDRLQLEHATVFCGIGHVAAA